MKILIRISDHAVIHAGDDLVLTAAECVGDGWVDRNFNTSNAVLADADLPADWMGAEWSFSAGVWTLVNTEQYDQRRNTALQVLKVAKIAAINAKRDVLETQGFAYSGLWFQSDERSTQRIANAAVTASTSLMASQAFSVDWMAADNTPLTLDAMGMLSLQAALTTHAAALHGYARVLKGQASSATSIEELDAVLVDSGWP